MSSEAVKAQSSFATTIIRAIREIMQNACPFTRQGARQARGLADEGMQMITRLEGWTTLLFFFLFVRWTHVKIECTTHDVYVRACVYVYMPDDIVI